MSNGTVSKPVKTFLRYVFDNRCTRCGWNEINPVTGKVPVEVEHIDGDWRNNAPENLTLLCPNCHSLTATYKALNTNGRPGRKNYRTAELSAEA